MAGDEAAETPPESPLRAAVREFVTVLARERRSSRHTVDAYARDLAQLALFAEKKRPGLRGPEGVDVLLLRGWLGQLATSLEPASIARKMAAARAFFRHQIVRGKMKDNPAAALSLPKVRKKLPRVLNVDAAKGAVEAPDDADENATRDRAVMELLYSSGLRVSELVGLDLDRLVLEEDRAEARVIGKGDKERRVPIGEPARVALAKYLDERRLVAASDPAAVFLSRRGRRMSVRSVQTLVKKYGALGAGRGDLHPHALRHTCATHMLDGGADLRAIQELLGHASLATTQRYTHVSVEQLMRVYDSAHPLARRKSAASGGGRG
ncbi:MAG TPA: tyrosine recombinase XerC [Polyangiaceae bacterium]|jgi:integrase/recombinase XerC|nr:tyrosine recombinase XerC [Polyangiaceae bacterium]